MNIKELKQLIKLCRNNGISHIKLGDAELSFTEEAIELKASPVKVTTGANASPDQVEAVRAIQDAFKGDELTEEQLLLWSVGAQEGNGTPEDLANEVLS